MQVRDGGVWKNASPYVKDGGVWKPAKEVWVKEAGDWKKVWQNFTPALTANMTVGVQVTSTLVLKGYNPSIGLGSMSSNVISVPGKTFTVGLFASQRISGEAPFFSLTVLGTLTQADADLLNRYARQVFINGVLLQESVPGDLSWKRDDKFGSLFYAGIGAMAALLNDPIDRAAQGTILPIVIGN